MNSSTHADPVAAATPNEREVEVFFAALNLPDPAERAAYLDVACADSPALRSWIEGELRRQLNPDEPSDATAVGGGQTTRDAGATGAHDDLAAAADHFAAFRPEAPGERIGSYTLVRQLGEGGVGAVWLAEQERPVRRQVALKVIRVGADSRETLARFAQERQALALMDHPNIAKVFDAGATPTGRPFFVMELVRGSTITEYCDGFRLTIRKRLALLMEVCHAIGHAHQKGIIHRDLKPSNVLVARREDDGVAVPKVIDFGIAKALAPRPLTELTLVTMADLMLGTPLYMSPEQARSALDVDTRCDVYSLGVILHELLVGRTPVDPAAVNACRSFEEVRRLVLDDATPPRLTARLRELPAEGLDAVARERGRDPRDLLRELRGDLEWIVLRALEKDRERRYASPQELAADLGRYLTDQPVVARPPSAGYRLGKLWQRHRGKLLAAGAVAAALVIGAGIAVFEAARARTAETRARTAQVQETAQRQRAEAERIAARRSEYVADIGLAQQSLRGGNLQRAIRLLEQHRPGAGVGGEEDLRGFAWRYLWGLCRGEEEGGVPFPDQRGPADAVAFSPDGTLLAIGSLAGVMVCDVRTRAVVARLPAPKARTLLFLRDGRTLLTHSGFTLRLWRTADWTEQGAWTEGRGALAFSPDGTRLAIAGSDAVVVRDPATWRETARLPGASAPLAFSPDGRTLATNGTTPAGITLWPMTGGGNSAPRTLTDSQDVFAAGQVNFFSVTQGLSFTGDGASLVAVENGLSKRGVFVLGVWDVRSGRRAATFPDDPARPEHTGAITSAVSSPDGRLLATASLDHSVRLWDVARRRSVALLQGHRAEVLAVTFSPDGRTLASCDRLGQVKTWRAGPEQSPETVLPEAVRPLAFADGGRTLAVRTPRRTVAFFDAATREPRGREIVPDPAGGAFGPVAVSADGSTVAQGFADGRVRLWNAADRDRDDVPPRRVPVLANGRPVDTLALTPDGGTLIAGTHGEPLQVHDLRTGTTRPLPLPVGRVALSANGQRLLALPPAATAAMADAPMPDMGTVVAAANADAGKDPVVVWDLTAHAPLARLPVNRAAVFDATLSADGSRAATVTSDGVIRLWDARTGTPGAVCVGHKQLVFQLAFTHDGRTLASASDDGTVRLWNVHTGQELLSLPHLGGRMTALRFSPNDRFLAVSRANGTQPLGTWLHHAPAFAETDR